MASPQELLDVGDRTVRLERGGRPATDVVFEAIRRTGLEPTDRAPLVEAIDGDALNDLVPPGRDPEPVVTFEVWGRRVAVTPAAVEVFDTEACEDGGDGEGEAATGDAGEPDERR